MSIDATGSIWITDSGSPGDVARFSSGGFALSPATGYTNGVANPVAIAIDSSGNVWIQNTNTQNGAYGTTVLNGASGTPFISSVGGTLVGATGQRQMAADGSGNVWVPDFCGVLASEPSATNPGILSSKGYGGPTLGNPSAVAIDGANRAWVAGAGGYNCDVQGAVPPSVSLVDVPNGYAFVDQSLSNLPQSMAVDGSGNLWILLGNNSVTEFVGVANPAVTPLASAVKNKKLGARP
jgi:hypothetical protein